MPVSGKDKGAARTEATSEELEKRDPLRRVQVCEQRADPDQVKEVRFKRNTRRILYGIHSMGPKNASTEIRAITIHVRGDDLGAWKERPEISEHSSVPASKIKDVPDTVQRLVGSLQGEIDAPQR
jgi:hypothetical protein